MTTKEKILQMLLQTPEGISGQQLAMKLGITRSAVWKAVQQLKAEGCVIDGVTNRGYRLLKGSDKLSAEIIAGETGAEVEVFSCVGSTNLIAKEKAALGAPHGSVIIADSQSSGRGRRGRSFFSSGSGIYMSIILRPDMDLSHAPLVTAAAAVAVRDAIAQICGKECAIKWVNDIFLEGKKVCGILTEAVTDVESGIIDSVVVGIGINFRGGSDDFPQELRDIAGFIFEPEETAVTRSELAAEVVANVLKETEDLEGRAFLESYRRNSLVLGQRVEYTRGGSKYVATALEIDENGGLEVLRDDGIRETISAGEISVKPVMEKKQ